MNRHLTILSMALCLVMLPAVERPAKHATAAEEADRPLATALADDEDTRGDWIGVYGSYAYILCGMRAPVSLYGGKGWPVEFSVNTGDPKEVARAWLSSAPAKRDRTVLLEPSGIRRTPGVFDDHGEVRPLGKGPDLHLRISIPEGPFLLSLYFFEVDWIQYRAHRVRLFAENENDTPLLTTHVDNFLKGKYKRFVVVGPASLRIVIERGLSPNAQVAGIFLDELGPPDMSFLDGTKYGDRPDDVATPPDIDAAHQSPGAALARLVAAHGAAAAREDYLRREIRFFRIMQAFERTRQEAYYRSLETTWTRAGKRIDCAVDLLGDSAHYLDGRILRYYAARAQCDWPRASAEASGLARALYEQSLKATRADPAQVEHLRRFAVGLMERGRRNEARPFLEAYVAYCLGRRAPQSAKDDLMEIGRTALTAGVSLPVAQGLDKWEKQHGRLSGQELLLLGSLYYVAGRNSEALSVYESVETELMPGRQHAWCRIAMLTALLRMDRLAEAQAVLDRLGADYPDGAELDEARYRLGDYHFDKRDLKRAEECFHALLETTESPVYKRMCREYIERIEHFQEVELLKSAAE